MSRKKNTQLKIERFFNDEDIDFRIYSKKGMLSILRDIAKRGTRVALYYNEEHDFILTTLLYVSEEGLWLDVGPSPTDNTSALLSDNITFISTHQQVKVQFTTHGVLEASFEDDKVFYTELPDYLLRIQRRNSFRLRIPAKSPLKCIMPLTPAVQSAESAKQDVPAPSREITVMDIGIGGMALLCDDKDVDLQPGKSYPNCQISLPGIGIIFATIKIKNIFEENMPGGQLNKLAGCKFIDLKGDMSNLLQRYVNMLQKESMALQ